jgi:pterin-4a-carbinolamine dehydratase
MVNYSIKKIDKNKNYENIQNKKLYNKNILKIIRNGKLFKLFLYKLNYNLIFEDNLIKIYPNKIFTPKYLILSIKLKKLKFYNLLIKFIEYVGIKKSKPFYFYNVYPKNINKNKFILENGIIINNYLDDLELLKNSLNENVDIDKYSIKKSKYSLLGISKKYGIKDYFEENKDNPINSKIKKEYNLINTKNYILNSNIKTNIFNLGKKNNIEKNIFLIVNIFKKEKNNKNYFKYYLTNSNTNKKKNTVNYDINFYSNNYIKNEYNTSNFTDTTNFFEKINVGGECNNHKYDISKKYNKKLKHYPLINNIYSGMGSWPNIINNNMIESDLIENFNLIFDYSNNGEYLNGYNLGNKKFFSNYKYNKRRGYKNLYLYYDLIFKNYKNKKELNKYSNNYKFKNYTNNNQDFEYISLNNYLSEKYNLDLLRTIINSEDIIFKEKNKSKRNLLENAGLTLNSLTNTFSNYSDYGNFINNNILSNNYLNSLNILHFDNYMYKQKLNKNNKKNYNINKKLYLKTMLKDQLLNKNSKKLSLTTKFKKNNINNGNFNYDGIGFLFKNYKYCFNNTLITPNKYIYYLNMFLFNNNIINKIKNNKLIWSNNKDFLKIENYPNYQNILNTKKITKNNNFYLFKKNINNIKKNYLNVYVDIKNNNKINNILLNDNRYKFLYYIDFINNKKNVKKTYLSKIIKNLHTLKKNEITKNKILDKEYNYYSKIMDIKNSSDKNFFLYRIGSRLYENDLKSLRLEKNDYLEPLFYDILKNSNYYGREDYLGYLIDGGVERYVIEPYIFYLPKIIDYLKFSNNIKNKKKIELSDN